MCGSLLRPWPAWPLYPYWQSTQPRPYHLSTLNSWFQNNSINTCSVTWAEWNNVELRVWHCYIRRHGALSVCNTRTSKDGDRKMEWIVPTEEIVEFHLPLLLPVDHFHMLVYLLLAAVSCFVPFHSDPCYYTLQLLLCEHTAEREGTQSWTLSYSFSFWTQPLYLIPARSPNCASWTLPKVKYVHNLYKYYLETQLF